KYGREAVLDITEAVLDHCMEFRTRIVLGIDDPPRFRPDPDPGVAHFGGCPICHKYDGHANVGRSHVFYCKEHKKAWNVGSNLFSGWADQTEEEQRRIWDKIGLDQFEEVAPYHGEAAL